MPLHAHLLFTPDDAPLLQLRAQLHPDIILTTGDLPPNPTVQLLVTGRPTREQIETCLHLHTLLIPFAGLPAETRTLMQDYPHIAVHNLHHNAIPTAEMALALLMAAARLLIPADRALREHDWTPRYAPLPATLLYGKTALILGYGAIAARLAPVLETLGMTVLGVRRRHLDPDQGIHGLESLYDLLPQTHALIITLPGTPDTAGLISARELALLPRGALLVNVGRATVVDQHALYDALASGHLHGAGLDVWYQYPTSPDTYTSTAPAEAPLHTLDNVVLSPHRGGAGRHPEVEILRMDALAKSLNAAAEGLPMPHRIDLQAGY